MERHGHQPKIGLSLQFLIAGIYLVSFWDFVARWIPASTALQAALSQVPELVVYAGILLAQFKRINSTGRMRLAGSGIDGALFAFMGWAILSSCLASPESLLISFLNIKALVRYIFVFFLVASIEWNYLRYLAVRRAFYNAFLLQMAIGVLQIVIGQPAVEFFSPRSFEGVLGLDRIAFADRGKPSIEVFGAFRNTISFAYLMLIGAILVLVSRKKISHLPVSAGVVLALVMAYFSGSRIVFFFLVVLVFLNWSGLEVSWKRTNKWLIAMPIVIVATVFAYMSVLSLGLNFEKGSVAYVLSPDYLEGAMNARLGIVTYVLPETFSKPQIFLGFGADKMAIADYLSDILNVPNIALLVTLNKTLEDVYWGAILLYFGIPGFALFLVLWLRIYGAVGRVVRSQAGWVSEAAVVAKILLLASVPFNLINQAFEVQVFSLAMWTFAAIAIKAPGLSLLPGGSGFYRFGDDGPHRLCLDDHGMK